MAPPAWPSLRRLGQGARDHEPALTAATLALALAGRGITRRSRLLIIAAYASFVVTVVATAH